TEEETHPHVCARHIDDGSRPEPKMLLLYASDDSLNEVVALHAIEFHRSLDDLRVRRLGRIGAEEASDDLASRDGAYGSAVGIDQPSRSGVFAAGDSRVDGHARNRGIGVGTAVGAEPSVGNTP